MSASAAASSASPSMSSSSSGIPGSFRHLTMCSGVRASATRNPGKIALIEGTRRVTYAQFIENLNRAANAGLHHLGLGPGATAAIIAPNCIEYLEIVAAMSEIGVAMVTPNPRLTPGELADICNDAQVQVVFIHASCRAQFDAAQIVTLRHVVDIGQEYRDLKARASDRFHAVPVTEWSTFAIPYTSGTTGKPKGVMLSHRSRSLGFLAYAAEYGIYSPDDHFLAFTPMCHGAGFAYAFASLFLGGTTEIMAKFDAHDVLAAVHSGRVTGMFTVPTHYHSIFGLEPRQLDALRGNRLKGIVANAAPLSQEAKARIVDYFGAGLLHETYGSTEAGVVTNLRPADQLRKTKCVGLPFVGNRVRLLGDDGREVPQGEVGELFSTSPYLFNGYWGKPAQTEEAFRDGWVSVGDLARRDEEGYLYIVDRKKDMVISGGLNIYPREIETVLDAHPMILESAAIGVPDERWGEQLVAFLVLEAGQSLSTDELDQYSRSHLAPYKLPKEFRTIAALPRNANGKILKTHLRALYAEAAPSLR